MPRKKSMRAVIKALRETGGQVSKAAELLGVTRGTLYAWIRGDERLQTVRDEFREMVNLERLDLMSERLDTAEDKLFERVKGGDLTACIFFLKCQGKERGWIDRADALTAEEVQAIAASLADAVLRRVQDPEVAQQIVADLRERLSKIGVAAGQGPAKNNGAH